MKVKKQVKKIFQRIEKFFIAETKQNYILHQILLIVNIFLFLLAVVDILASQYNFQIPSKTIHSIEFFFGILFSIEMVLRLYYVYIPNKIYFKPYILLNFLVILSLLVPQIFGNLAILRIIRSLKIIKIFILNKEVEKLAFKQEKLKN